MRICWSLRRRQPGDFELLEKDRAAGRRQDSEDQAQDGALAAAALAHDDEAIERLDHERDALEHFFFLELEMDIAQLDDRRWRSVLRSRGRKHGVNDVKERIEADHGGDRRDDARSGGGADARRAALDVEAAITRDRADEQAEQEGS